ncbi:MAG TPA: LysR family transcriptional regulator, partial [Dyella sp.]|uniref:helix-turn-helix domain-containing protein n=1 Tax=Dyella sp. TaxID=1869338 RepID=UPI002F9482A5
MLRPAPGRDKSDNHGYTVHSNRTMAMGTPLTAVNLNRIVVFVAVVETRSFTAAAARLGLAKTMVST